MNSQFQNTLVMKTLCCLSFASNKFDKCNQYKHILIKSTNQITNQQVI